MKLRWRSLGIAAAAGVLALVACSDDTTTPGSSTAGAPGAGSTSGGSASGGSATAGTSAAGTSTAGTSATGGTSTAGTSTGGTSGGGSAGTSGGGTGGTAGGNAGGAPGDGGAGGDTTGPCTTSFDGVVLHSFDTPGSSAGWAVKVNLGTPADNLLGDASVARDPSVGHTCPGSLRLDVPFSAYAADAGSSVTAVINYSPTQMFPNEPGAEGGAGAMPATLPILHAWVKVENDIKSALFLNGAQPFVNTQSYTKYANKFTSVDATWNNGTWHELTLDFATVCTSGGYCSDGTPNPDEVLQLGIEMLVRQAAGGDGPAAPVASKIYIDDIWVE